MSKVASPQQSPATALAQLIAEHPELPHMFWTITPDGHLTGSTYGVDDAGSIVRQVAAVLGGAPYSHDYTGASDGRVRPSQHLNTRWRDVEFHITVVGCPAAVAVA